MAADRGRLQPGLLTPAPHLDHVGERAHLALDAVEADQRVQFAEHRSGRTRGLGGTSAATGSTARGAGTAPSSSPGADWVAVRTAGGGGVAVRRALSSLVQSSTTGPVAEVSPCAPPSANS